MNTNRLIWFATTLLFGLVGAVIGRWMGLLYIQLFEQTTAPLLADKPMGTLVVWGLAIGGAAAMVRVGSWAADRWAIPTAALWQQLSATDRVLSVVGSLVGLMFGVLLTLPLLSLPDRTLWLPVQVCAMLVFAALGMALAGGLRAEVVRAFPLLEGETVAPPTHGSKAKLLDTNIIIDGRMADMCKTGFIEGPLVVPSFVLDEVQYIADSADAMRRGRGRRGLEVLNVMREIHIEQTRNGQVHEMPLVQVLTEIPLSVQKIDTVDSKLVGLARELDAVIVTNDYNLNRVAELQGVRVLNINELVQALKPVVLPGEEMNLTIVKEGKEVGQGVGYLEDGTMVVVGDGQHRVGETCKVVISSVYQTVAGKMIFADIKNAKGSGDDLFDDAPAANHSNRKGRR